MGGTNKSYLAYDYANSLRICFKIILNLSERYLGIDLRCQGAANSGLFARIESAKMLQRAPDKAKSRFKYMLALI